MTIDLDSGTGLFDRLGRIFYVMELIEAFLAGTSADDLPTEFNDILEEFDAETNNDVRNAVKDVLGGLATFQTSAQSLHGTLLAAARNVVIEMADADNSLPQRQISSALDELKRQMESGSETVDANEPTIGQSSSGNDGDGKLVLSLLNGRGEAIENALPEDILCKVTSTSTAGSESWSARGERNLAGNRSSVFWPSGSGGSKSLTTIDPTVRNLLTNGAFNDFTSDAPNSWTIDTGAAPTNLDDETTLFYRGAAALKLIGDAGLTLTKISQSLTGPSAHVPYVCHVWTRVEASAPAAGVLQIDLWDGSAVINDESGTANSFTVDLTSEAATYAAHSAVFRLPDPLPATITLRVHLTTALTNTKLAYIDDLCLVAMDQLYTGGPYASFITGDSTFGLDDEFVIAVTNDFRGKFQKRFLQVSNDPTFMVPSVTGGTETINDNLIA